MLQREDRDAPLPTKAAVRHWLNYRRSRRRFERIGTDDEGFWGKVSLALADDDQADGWKIEGHIAIGREVENDGKAEEGRKRERKVD